MKHREARDTTQYENMHGTPKQKSVVKKCLLLLALMLCFLALMFLLSNRQFSITLKYEDAPEVVSLSHDEQIPLPTTKTLPSEDSSQPKTGNQQPISGIQKSNTEVQQALLGRWQLEHETRPGLIEFLENRMCNSWSTLNQQNYFCKEYEPYAATNDTILVRGNPWLRWRITQEKLELTEVTTGKKDTYVRITSLSSKRDITQLTEAQRQKISRTHADPDRGFTMQFPPLFEPYTNTFEPRLIRNFHDCFVPVDHEGLLVRDFAASKYIDVYDKKDVLDCKPVPSKMFVSVYTKDLSQVTKTIPITTKDGSTAHLFRRTLPNTNLTTGITTAESHYEALIELPERLVGEFRAIAFNYYPQNVKGGLICGDNLCDAGETALFCAADCKEPRNIEQLLIDSFKTFSFSAENPLVQRAVKPPVVSSWKTYVNNDYHFSIEYPSNFEAREIPYPKTLEQWKDFGNYTGYNLVTFTSAHDPGHPEWHEGSGVSIMLRNNQSIPWSRIHGPTYFADAGIPNVGDEKRIPGSYDNRLGEKHILVSGKDAVEVVGLSFAQYLFSVDVYNWIPHGDLIFEIGWSHDYATIPAAVPLYEHMRDSFTFLQ